jgi:hypothetical protein
LETSGACPVYPIESSLQVKYHYRDDSLSEGPSVLITSPYSLFALLKSGLFVSTKNDIQCGQAIKNVSVHTSGDSTGWSDWRLPGIKPAHPQVHPLNRLRRQRASNMNFLLRILHLKCKPANHTRHHTPQLRTREVLPNTRPLTM